MKYCLIVDDSKVVRKVVSKIVLNLSFEIDEAENGIEALAKCEQKTPNVILLDWNMPEMDGMQMLQKLRSMPKFNDVIVVFCTTENDIQKIQHALEAGANEFIMKPFNADIITDKFNQLGLIN